MFSVNIFISLVIILAGYSICMFLLGKGYGQDELKEKYDLVPKTKK